MLGGFWNKLGGLFLFLIVFTVCANALGPNGDDAAREAAEAAARQEAAK